MEFRDWVATVNCVVELAVPAATEVSKDAQLVKGTMMGSPEDSQESSMRR